MRPAGGFLGALRTLGATLADTLGVRGSLFALELREDLERRKQMLVMALAAAVFLHMALLAATLLVAVVFWETHRVAALIAMTGLYLAAGGGALLGLRRRIAASPPPFEATLGELQQDLAQWRAPR